MIREIVTEEECNAARDMALSCLVTAQLQNDFLLRVGDFLAATELDRRTFELLMAEIREYVDMTEPALKEKRNRAWTENVYQHFHRSAPKRPKPFVWRGHEYFIATHSIQRIVDSNFNLLQQICQSIQSARGIFGKRLTFWNLLPVTNILTLTDINAEWAAAIKNLNMDMRHDSLMNE